MPIAPLRPLCLHIVEIFMCSRAPSQLRHGMWATWNQPQEGYQHHQNWQSLRIRDLFRGGGLFGRSGCSMPWRTDFTGKYDLGKVTPCFWALVFNFLRSLWGLHKPDGTKAVVPTPGQNHQGFLLLFKTYSMRIALGGTQGSAFPLSSPEHADLHLGTSGKSYQPRRFLNQQAMKSHVSLPTPA